MESYYTRYWLTQQRMCNITYSDVRLNLSPYYINIVLFPVKKVIFP